MKPLAERLRDRVNDLMAQRGWKSNKPVIAASGGRVSNGTLGRVRQQGGENVKLSFLEDLAVAFGIDPQELLTADSGDDWRRTAYSEAASIRDEDLRNWALALLERVDNTVEERRKLAALAPKITSEVNSSHAMSGQADKK